jgi:predicted DNA-binding transcriptional regulator AlpA
MRRKLSTTEVAQKLGLDQANLQRLIREKRIPFPPLVSVGRLKIRLWTARDVKRVRQVLADRRSRRKK